MAVNDSSKVDILWKKVAFGVAETSQASKDATNESIPSPTPVYGHTVWAKSGDIPATAPDTSTSIVGVYKGSTAIKCVVDPTVASRRTWVAVTDANVAISNSNRLSDWIPPTFDPTYTVKVWAGIPTDATSVQLNAITHEFYFDYVSGVIYFINGLPSTVGANTSLYIEGYRYIGEKGASGSGLSPEIEQMLRDLIPAPPPNLSELPILFEGGQEEKYGQRILLSAGASNMLNGVDPGMAITQFVDPITEVSTKVLADFAKGDEGTMSAVVDNAQHGHIDLAPGMNLPLRNGSLEIVSQKKWPDNFPYHKVLSAKGYIPHTLGLGVHKIKLSHSITGATADKFCVFAETVTPALTSLSSEVITAGNSGYRFSSGIPHYTSGAQFRVNFNLEGLAGQTYLEGNVTTVKLVDGTSLQNVQSSVNLNPGDNGIPVILTNNDTTPISTYADVTIGTNYASTAVFKAQPRNPYMEGAVRTENKRINIISVTNNNRNKYVLENNIPLVNMGDPVLMHSQTGFRVPFKPTFPSGYTGWNSAFNENAWDSARDLRESDYTHEAVVVGGSLKWDRTNYDVATFDPRGLDYSQIANGAHVRQDVQYASFAFRRKYISRFKINIVGTYENIFVHFPTVVPNNKLFTMRDWAPAAGIPMNGVAVGKLITYDPITGTNDPGGIARSGSYICSLGTLNSSSSYENMIVVVIELRETQKVDFLSFSSVNTPDIQV